MLRGSLVLAYRLTIFESICHPSIMANVVNRAREGEEPGRLGRPFWQLWSASSLSNLADGLVKVALPLIAVTLTDSPGMVAGVTLAVTLPWLLFALPAGALADRLDRRIAMVTATSSERPRWPSWRSPWSSGLSPPAPRSGPCTPSPCCSE